MRTKFSVKKLIIAFTALILFGLLAAILFRKTEEANVPFPEPNPTVSQDEQSALVFPPMNASDEEKKQHFDLVSRVAKNAEKIDITGCKPSPVVTRVRDGNTLVIDNRDVQDHSITLGDVRTLTIISGASEGMTVDFETGPGLYVMRCDASRDAVGILFVESSL